MVPKLLKRVLLKIILTVSVARHCKNKRCFPARLLYKEVKILTLFSQTIDYQMDQAILKVKKDKKLKSVKPLSSSIQSKKEKLNGQSTEV